MNFITYKGVYCFQFLFRHKLWANQGIKALLDFDELNIEGKLDTLLERVSDTEATDVEIERKVKEETTDKMKEIEKLVLPLLVNFIKPESLEQEYIYWPNRKEIIERQIQRILSITRG